MAVRVGPSPFGDYSAYQNFKRATKKQQKDWTLKGWKKPAMRDLTSNQGNSYKVPEDDYADYMTFFRSAVDTDRSEQYDKSGRLRDVQTPADYIDYAFGKNTKIAPVVQEGVGHISLLEYSVRYQILKVTFTNNGSVVAFFRVPKTVAATLMALAQTGTTRADGRHLLGVYFWDLIRIRGTVHGSRYKFTYVKDNGTGGLPGRPFGSGQYFYDVSTGPNKNIEAKIKALEDVQTMQNGFDSIIAALNKQLANGADPDIINGLIKALNDTPAASDEEKALVKEELENLRASQYNVTRRNKRVVSEQFTDPTEAMLATRTNPKAPITEEQQLMLDEVARVVKGYVTPDEATKGIRKHNVMQRIERSWDNERVSNLVEQLASENKLGKGGINAFNNHFPNITEQFDYLKHRGFIPADARYTN